MGCTAGASIPAPPDLQPNTLPLFFGLFPVTNNLLDNSSDIYLIVYGMIRSDRLIIRGPCVLSYIDWLHQVRDPWCNIHLQTSLSKLENSFFQLFLWAPLKASLVPLSPSPVFYIYSLIKLVWSSLLQCGSLLDAISLFMLHFNKGSGEAQ